MISAEWVRTAGPADDPDSLQVGVEGPRDRPGHEIAVKVASQASARGVTIFLFR
jgi:hypothetical protein